MLESPEDLIPQVAAGKFTAKVIFTLIVGAIVLAGGSFVIWKVFFAERAAQAKSERVENQGRSAISEAGAKSGVEAIKITVDNGKAAAGIDAAVRSAIDEIRKAKGAEVAVDPSVDAAGRRAICLRPSAAGLPECQRLLGTGP